MLLDQCILRYKLQHKLKYKFEPLKSLFTWLKGAGKFPMISHEQAHPEPLIQGIVSLNIT